MASGLHVSVALAGQLTAVFSLSFALMAPCVPLLGHQIRPRPLYLSALALFVFGNVLAALHAVVSGKNDHGVRQCRGLCTCHYPHHKTGSRFVARPCHRPYFYGNQRLTRTGGANRHDAGPMERLAQRI
ncbi:protein of unknown function [Alcaligenes faecalis subsp. faecalis]|nr:protein of unknown function [Alcaligenes faecalis subsp. faecalis]